jgi:hypothetical protein
MELGSERVALRDDEQDMFVAAAELGEYVDDWDPVTQTATEKRFTRGEQWKEALNAIRK